MLSFLKLRDSDDFLIMQAVNGSTGYVNAAFTFSEYLPLAAVGLTKAECEAFCKKQCVVDMTPAIYETTVKAEGQEFAAQTDVADVWRCPKAGHKNLKGGEIAGITVGCVLFVAIVVIAVVVLLWCTRRGQKKQASQLHPVK